MPRTPDEQAWSGSKRRTSLPKDWQVLRQRVLERDAHQCQQRTDRGFCLAPADQVDHIIPGQDHSMVNLRSLCKYHHGKKSSREGNYSPNRRKRTERKPGEQHPGLT